MLPLEAAADARCRATLAADFIFDAEAAEITLSDGQRYACCRHRIRQATLADAAG